jgi:hypothetical protein
MKTYIMKNTELRIANYKNEFLKDYYKLMNNAVFGKTMENVRLRQNIELIYEQKRLNKILASGLYKEHTIINEYLTMVHKYKSKVILDKPVSVGMSILDFSKLTMYEFYYDHLQAQYGHENLKVIYGDTDSIIYQVFTDDYYNDMIKNKNIYDLTAWKNEYHDETNNNVLGKFKDECSNDIINEVVAIRSKLYTYSTENMKIGKRAKGIKKNVTENELMFNDFKNCLFDDVTKNISQNFIRSEN